MTVIYTSIENATIQYRPRAWSVYSTNPRSGNRLTTFNSELIQIINGVEQPNSQHVDPVEISIPNDPIEVMNSAAANEVITITDPFTGDVVSAKIYQIALMYEKYYCDKYKAKHPEMQWVE